MHEQAQTNCPVIVMAKAPHPGFAKTRLIPALGAQGAALLAQRLLKHALTQAAAAGLGDVDLCCAPDADDALFAPWSGSDIRFSDQGTGDLGQRMSNAFARWLPQTGQALLMGTDCPGISADVLRLAASALGQTDAVFIPALDGGYALIGLRGCDITRFTAIFNDMQWSHPGVMATTRQRLAGAGLAHHELPALPDIDEPADLQHLPPGWLA